MVNIVHAKSKQHIDEAKKVFVEYAESLGFSLCFQDFDKELANLPGDYAQPSGRLLLAFDNSQIIGCIALRKLAEGICEMKRLYVRSEYRGKGIGKKLADSIIEEAKAIGYHRMLLDTLPVMKEATAMYRSMGFSEIPSYYRNPVEGALFMELTLS